MKRNATFPTPAIPALDLTPSGRLPHTVAQALTPAQADGIACIDCGREDGPMIPAGTINGCQVFRCSPACTEPDTSVSDDKAAAEQPAGPCPVYRDCNVPETGHFDHSAHDMKVLDERDSSTVLDAGMVALSGDEEHVIVYVGVAEYADLDGLKAKTQELRRFLDEVDAMADRVFADHQARG